MAKLYDWVKQTVSGTPGTGAITLSTAVPTYITSEDAGIPNGELVYYTIVDGNNRERGIGTYSTTGPTLTRTFIQGKLESGTYTENPGTGLNLTLAAIVGCSPVAATHNFRGCLLEKTVDQAIPANVYTSIAFDSEVYDTDGFHDNVTNNSQIIIPANKGIRLVQFFGGIDWAGSSVNHRILRLAKNSVNTYPGSTVWPTGTQTYAFQSIASPMLPCVDGDIFELAVLTGDAINIEVTDEFSPTFFGCKVIE